MSYRALVATGSDHDVLLPGRVPSLGRRPTARLAPLKHAKMGCCRCRRHAWLLTGPQFIMTPTLKRSRNTLERLQHRKECLVTPLNNKAPSVVCRRGRAHVRRLSVMLVRGHLDHAPRCSVEYVVRGPFILLLCSRMIVVELLDTLSQFMRFPFKRNVLTKFPVLPGMHTYRALVVIICVLFAQGLLTR